MSFLMRNSLVTLALVLFPVLSIPVQLAAQDNHNHHKHHYYKLVDLGTFGGPRSRNDGIEPPLNNRGTVIGMADTSTPDPFYPNFNPLIEPGGASDPFIFHAFQWQDGQLVDLGSLPGGYSAYPSGISENGLIAGEAINGALDPISGWPEENAVFWKDGQILNLGTLGGYESAAGQVNSRGQTTGFTTNAIPDPYSIIYSLFNGLSNGTQTRAYVWDKKHGMKDLGTLGGPDAFAPYINEHGEVAGVSYTSSTPNPSGFPTIDPFLWEPPTRQFPNGKMIDLGSLGGTSGGEGDGVSLNDNEQVIGSSNLAGDAYFHPFLWTKPGPMQDLGTFGGNFGIANVINEAGDVVGWATNTGDQAVLAFLWKSGTMTNLGTLAGDVCSYAFGINSKDQVVGASDDCAGGNSHAFLWENGGPIVDLNTLVGGADMTLIGPTSINDRGEITGLGVLTNGDLHAFLLIPCDDNNGDSECEDEGEGTAVARGEASQRPNVILPENVRRMLHQRLGSRYHIRGLDTPKN